MKIKAAVKKALNGIGWYIVVMLHGPDLIKAARQHLAQAKDEAVRDELRKEIKRMWLVPISFLLIIILSLFIAQEYMEYVTVPVVADIG